MSKRKRIIPGEENDDGGVGYDYESDQGKRNQKICQRAINDDIKFTYIPKVPFRRRNISVKLDTNIYQLSQLELALKSDYFEVLLTGNFNKRERNLTELQTIDNNTFTHIIDVIYGADLKSVLSVDNYIDMLIAMDYLQMEINLKTYRTFLDQNLQIPLSRNSTIFKLYYFMAYNSNYECLLSTILQYFSAHLIELPECEEFLSFTCDQVVEIISKNQHPLNAKEKCQIDRICAKWICYDMPDRLHRIADLVNAAKYRYQEDYFFNVDVRKLRLKFLYDIDDEEIKFQEVRTFFINLLNQNGPIVTVGRGSRRKKSKNATKSSIINKIDEKKKWATYLEHGYFYDITVKVEGKLYKLHRSKLESKSKYFAELFSKEYRKSNEQHGQQYTDKNKEYSLNISRSIFDIIVKFVYFEEFILNPDTLTNVMKASVILIIEDLTEKCEPHVVSHLNNGIRDDDFIDLLNLFSEKDKYDNLRNALYDRVIDTWPNISEISNFACIQSDTLMRILMLLDLPVYNEYQIIDVCSEWIAHDAKNRYSLIPRIANAICRNMMVNYGEYKIEIPNDLQYCSFEFIRRELWRVLSSSWSIAPDTDRLLKRRIRKLEPVFIASRKRILNILDNNFRQIATIVSLRGFSSQQQYFQPTAVRIANKLFIMFRIKNKYNFLGYNISSNMFLSLALIDSIIVAKNCTLLNCNNQLYCCCDSGNVFKYFVELNRWVYLNTRKEFYKKALFASNGNAIYRVFPFEWRDQNFVVDEYNFNRNTWTTILLSKISSLNLPRNSKPLYLVNINSTLVILFYKKVFSFDVRSKELCEMTLPHKVLRNRVITMIGQFGNDLLYQYDNEVYHFFLKNGNYSSTKKILNKKFMSITPIHYFPK